MAFANPNVTDIIATTIQRRSRQIADNVTDNNAALRYMNKRGNVRPISGGNVILEEIAFADNTNAGFYSGPDLLPTAAVDVISAAEFPIRQASVQVVINGLEMLQNSGKEQMIDLLEGRLRVAESSLANLLSAGIYSDGTGFGGRQITGLQAAVPVNPNTGVYGGIDRATWAFWRNRSVDTSGVTAATILSSWNSLYSRLVRGSDAPDLVLVDDATWQLFVAALQANQRFLGAEKAEAGFRAIAYMGMDVVLDGGIDGNCPTNTAFFLNTKYLHWRPHAKRNVTTLRPSGIRPVNQDVEVTTIVWAGNLTCSGARFQGRWDNN
ncbi:MAG: phage major capsid protein [Bacteroidia bacterium]|nr:phage major capsid protein [Bacteroidia bacterium]